jgi:hypothetical protein
MELRLITTPYQAYKPIHNFSRIRALSDPAYEGHIDYVKVVVWQTIPTLDLALISGLVPGQTLYTFSLSRLVLEIPHVTRALRLLPPCISAAGREDVLRETQAALAPTEPAPQSKPHIGDGAARDALHKWGEMSEPEFLAFAIDVPMDLLTRAAALLGINMSSRVATGLKKIHKAATRFHRNTRT